MLLDQSSGPQMATVVWVHDGSVDHSDDAWSAQRATRIAHHRMQYPVANQACCQTVFVEDDQFRIHADSNNQ